MSKIHSNVSGTTALVEQAFPTLTLGEATRRSLYAMVMLAIYAMGIFLFVLLRNCLGTEIAMLVYLAGMLLTIRVVSLHLNLHTEQRGYQSLNCNDQPLNSNFPNYGYRPGYPRIESL